MIDTHYLLICCFAVFLGGILQGCLGFGFTFIALPVFALFIAPAIATPVIVCLSIILNFIAICNCIKHANKKLIGYLLIGGVAGTPIGALLLKNVDPDSYSLLVGILIMSSAGLFLSDKRFPVKDKMINYFPIGLISGALNASIGLSGPPVVLFMSNQQFDKDMMRSTLIGYFLIINIIALSWFIHTRLITHEVLFHMKYFAPAVIAGTLSGMYINRYITEELFKKIILICVFVVGFFLCIKSFLW